MTRRTDGPRIAALALMLTLAAGAAQAHCDSLDGPVVRDAQRALQRGEFAPVLKWVGEDGVAEVHEAFRAALAVRTEGARARPLADRYFFETLVRVHRAGEGEGFTGLKPAGATAPAIAAADRALREGSGARLSKELGARLAEAVETRYRSVRELERHANDNVDAGRAYVAAYVGYIHLVEQAERLIDLGASIHHDSPAGAAAARYAGGACVGTAAD